MSLRTPLLLVFCLAFVSGCTPSPPRVSSSADPVSPSPAQPVEAGSHDWRVPVDNQEAAAAVADWSGPPAAADEAGWVADWGIWGSNTDAQARALYEGLPLRLALRYSFGNPTREVVVFSDPYGQDDRRLVRILEDAKKNLNAVVYVFPLQGDMEVGSVARILCTSDPENSWWDWMKAVAPSTQEASALNPPRLPELEALTRWKAWEESHPMVPGCEGGDRADKIDEIASKAGVSFTPTVLFAHGRAWPHPHIEIRDIQDSWSYAHKRLGIKTTVISDSNK